MRDRWISKSSDLRAEKIVINENLSKLMKQLRWCAKQTATKKGYRFVWVQSGKVRMRKEVGTPIVRVESKRDLSKLTKWRKTNRKSIPLLKPLKYRFF